MPISTGCHLQWLSICKLTSAIRASRLCFVPPGDACPNQVLGRPVTDGVRCRTAVKVAAAAAQPPAHTLVVLEEVDVAHLQRPHGRLRPETRKHPAAHGCLHAA